MPVGLVGDERIGPEHRRQSLTGVARLFPHRRQLFHVARHMTGVPGEKYRFHIWEVLVKRGPPDAGGRSVPAW